MIHVGTPLLLSCTCVVTRTAPSSRPGVSVIRRPFHPLIFGNDILSTQGNVFARLRELMLVDLNGLGLTVTSLEPAPSAVR